MDQFPKYSKQGEDTEKMVEFQFCKVCNINQDHSKRHKYFPSHRTRLSQLLSKFESKLGELRSFLNNDAISTSKTSLWCIFCDFDIVDSSIYLRENAVSHLSSIEHRNKVKQFLWKHGKREPDNADTFCLLANTERGPSDLSKWDSKRKSIANIPRTLIGPSNYIQSLESSYASKFLNRDIPLQHHTNEFQIHSSTVNVKAKPPSLETYKEKRTNVGAGRVSKLNPKRVGAEWAERRKIEMEKEKRGEIPKRYYGPNWLPNFGRVWQSGSRKESLREFVKEKEKLPKRKQQLEEPLSVQPYISKRIVSSR